MSYAGFAFLVAIPVAQALVVTSVVLVLVSRQPRWVRAR